MIGYADHFYNALFSCLRLVNHFEISIANNLSLALIFTVSFAEPNTNYKNLLQRLRSLPKQPEQNIRGVLHLPELKDSASYSPSGWLQGTYFESSETCSGVETQTEFFPFGVCVSSSDGTTSYLHTAVHKGPWLEITINSYPTNGVCSGSPVVDNYRMTLGVCDGVDIYKYINGSAVPHSPYTNSISQR